MRVDRDFSCTGCPSADAIRATRTAQSGLVTNSYATAIRIDPSRHSRTSAGKKQVRELLEPHRMTPAKWKT
jgi:hypothetical protein